MQKAPQKPGTQPTTSKKAPSQVQVRGMIDSMVDGLWSATDKYFHDGDYVRVVSLCRICVEADQSFDEAYSAGGYLLWSMGEVPSAEAFLEYGTRRSKKPGSLNNEMGQQLYRTKNYPAALTYLQKAVKLGGVDVTAYSTLAHCYTRLNKHQEALQTWKQVVAKFPDFPAGPKNLKDAEARLKNGK
jgi:tetratricopeptide (TPR) repeat protein